MSNKRDEFPPSIKERLWAGVGTLCSRCGCATIWEENNKQQKCGEAAHIEAAAEGGARYNPNLSKEERKSYNNGIWLCSNCHKIVDSDEKTYTVELLKRLKEMAEKAHEAKKQQALKCNGSSNATEMRRALLSSICDILNNWSLLNNNIVFVESLYDRISFDFDLLNSFKNIQHYIKELYKYIDYYKYITLDENGDWEQYINYQNVIWCINDYDDKNREESTSELFKRYLDYIECKDEKKTMCWFKNIIAKEDELNKIKGEIDKRIEKVYNKLSHDINNENRNQCNVK